MASAITLFVLVVIAIRWRRLRRWHGRCHRRIVHRPSSTAGGRFRRQRCRCRCRWHNYNRRCAGFDALPIADVVAVAQQRHHCRVQTRILCVLFVHLLLLVLMLRVRLVREQSLLLFRALLLEEQPHIVDGKDDTLAGRLFGIDVDATHQHRVGAIEEAQQHERHDVRDYVAGEFVVWFGGDIAFGGILQINILIEYYQHPLELWLIECKSMMQN